MHPGYEKLREVIKSGEFEGVKFKILTQIADDGKEYLKELEPGDTYLAARNTGPHLLTVREIAMNAAFPVETAYPYNLHECVPIELISED